MNMSLLNNKKNEDDLSPTILLINEAKKLMETFRIYNHKPHLRREQQCRTFSVNSCLLAYDAPFTLAHEGLHHETVTIL